MVQDFVPPQLEMALGKNHGSQPEHSVYCTWQVFLASVLGKHGSAQFLDPAVRFLFLPFLFCLSFFGAVHVAIHAQKWLVDTNPHLNHVHQRVPN